MPSTKECNVNHPAPTNRPALLHAHLAEDEDKGKVREAAPQHLVDQAAVGVGAGDPRTHGHERRIDRVRGARARVRGGGREDSVQVRAAGRQHLHLAAAHCPEALDAAVGMHRACMHQPAHRAAVSVLLSTARRGRAAAVVAAALTGYRFRGGAHWRQGERQEGKLSDDVERRAFLRCARWLARASRLVGVGVQGEGGGQGCGEDWVGLGLGLGLGLKFASRLHCAARPLIDYICRRPPVYPAQQVPRRVGRRTTGRGGCVETAERT